MAKNLPHLKHSEAKTSHQFERYFKGVSHHIRIDILQYVSEHEEASLDSIVSALDGNIKTISHHTHKLVFAGLLNKKYEGHTVLHSLSPYGKKFIKFLDLF